MAVKYMKCAKYDDQPCGTLRKAKDWLAGWGCDEGKWVKTSDNSWELHCPTEECPAATIWARDVL